MHVLVGIFVIAALLAVVPALRGIAAGFVVVAGLAALWFADGVNQAQKGMQERAARDEQRWTSLLGDTFTVTGETFRQSFSTGRLTEFQFTATLRNKSNFDIDGARLTFTLQLCPAGGSSAVVCDTVGRATADQIVAVPAGEARGLSLRVQFHDLPVTQGGLAFTSRLTAVRVVQRP